MTTDGCTEFGRHCLRGPAVFVYAWTVEAISMRVGTGGSNP